MPAPATRRDETVVDVIHGVSVADPYRWLEDQESPEVAEWVAAQKAVTDAHLADIPQRAELRDRLAAVWDHPKLGVPWHRGDTWLQMRNSGVQEQPVLWTADAPDAEGRVLLDPTELSEDGTVSLADVALSPDGRLLAYGTSDGGSDWITWHVRDVTTGTDLPDEVRWAKFASAAWLPDSSGFFYGAYDPPAAGTEMAATNTHHQLRLHRLGDDGPDPVVHRRDDEPEWGFSPAVTEDGRWLVVTIWQGTEPRTRLHLASLDGDPAQPEIRPWLDDFDGEYGVVGNDGDTMFVRTDAGAPAGRLLAVDAIDPARRTEVLAERPEALVAVRWVGERFVVVRLVDAVHELAVHDREGARVAVVELPDLASVGSITGRRDDTAVHLSLSSFTSAAGVHRLDLTADPPVLQEVIPSPAGVPDAVTERVMVPSTDGAVVPMFLIRRADATGPRPTILYGYGGFGIPLTPEFRLWWTAWLERGGIIAVGCFRGGAEYGRAWHDAGRLDQKHHTFDDALACASWLVDEGWTTSPQLAITGGSNGGLTAAASMIRAPEAFGACVPEVGVLDLLRFHRFTIGWGWTSDYGDPDDPEDFPRIHGMSPLHTLTEGTCYPPTLVTTADRDDRVVPAHSFKFTAAMQRAQGCGNPVLARIDTRAGHGAGTPTSKVIDARADVLAFLVHYLGDPAGHPTAVSGADDGRPITRHAEG